MKEPQILDVDWPWSSPLEMILSYGGWTVDDALDDRATAREFHMYWRLVQESRKIREAQAKENEARERRERARL